MSRWTRIGLVSALVAGAVLRFIWPYDIEYKHDEKWMFDRTQEVGAREDLPILGMPTSAGFLNPGLNVWVFVGMGKLLGVTDPPGLARCVQLLSMVGLLLVVFLAVRFVPPHQREIWLWAVVLMALNPMAVIYHRKIWQPCLFPAFIGLFLICWWQRSHRWGAFLWGIVGALLGQVQMAGFFFAAGFCAWTLLFDRLAVRWRAWLVGSILGTLPMLPWLYYLATRPGGEDVTHSSAINLITLKFWVHWISQPLGFTIQYVLGRDSIDFMSYPILFGQPTYLIACLYLLLAGLAVWALWRSGRYLWQERARWQELVLGRGSSSGLAVAATMWGFGIMMTLSTMKVHRHYLLVAMPMIFVWLAWMTLGRREDERSWRAGRVCLLLLCVTQGLLSAGMLGYIHVNQRQIRGDFQTPYGAQAAGISFPSSCLGNRGVGRWTAWVRQAGGLPHVEKFTRSLLGTEMQTVHQRFNISLTASRSSSNSLSVMASFCLPNASCCKPSTTW